ncbi:LlaJI family restriction endonuclease [Mediterranea massiliensis]|uniref:LlaJI family restriction endonuclease n=1 Tax=Mediterranea massiliensis TaxID=1841865 RepID=UPI0023EFFC7A|nr:LlaJI family restriction endonuclease [Mediterranea massiliensis]
MLLFIEGYPYNLNATVRGSLTVRDILKDVVSIPAKEDTCSFEYVGYCYSKAAQDVLFFLPKVVLTGEQNEESEDDTIFGASPQEIIDFESDKVKSKFTEAGCKEYKEFLSTLSIWIYRTISVYRQHYNDNILESKEYQAESRGRKQKHNTLLDVIIALRDFNRDNQDYFTFIAKNIHSGYNKIHWNKTITSSQAIIQNGRPIYINPVNRKKMVNFDEELLVIYFSILNYIRDIHGFSFEINLHYQLISPDKLKQTYIKRNLGCRRLKQIKYKYFSDKALRIWDLCYAFFDREYKISMNRQAEDFLLAKDFEHIFEVMVDTLVGGNDKQNLPKELTEQRDGKLVDHMFVGQGLIEQSDKTTEQTYYIGDSKYYKRSKNDRTQLGDKSIYKQYTYAKNVIQWNMNLFLDGENKGGQPQLRDTLTEGYNLIPNFFISARIPDRRNGGSRFLSFDDKELKSQDSGIQLNRQFENRLFDRDTLLLCHYDVNFLYIVSLYGRDNKSSQTVWREYVRKEFRSKIQETLNRLYTFRTLQPRAGMDCYQFIQDNFQRLNGKLYRPKENGNYLILALMKNDEPSMWTALKVKPEAISKETVQNQELLDSLQSHFYVSKPFDLETDFHVDGIKNTGTLEKIPKPEARNILTGFIRASDKNLDDFLNHAPKTYTMERIPTSINVMDIEYFLPMIKGKIDGYYKVDKVYFGSVQKRPCLKLNLSTYIPLGEAQVSIYRSKMQPGELISFGSMAQLYKQGD